MLLPASNAVQSRTNTLCYRTQLLEYRHEENIHRRLACAQCMDTHS